MLKDYANYFMDGVMTLPGLVSSLVEHLAEMVENDQKPGEVGRADEFSVNFNSQDQGTLAVRAVTADSAGIDDPAELWIAHEGLTTPEWEVKKTTKDTEELIARLEKLTALLKKGMEA